jgi:CRP-like cAMP-binding protein
VARFSSNRLLSRLDERELHALGPHLVPVALNKGDILGGPGGASDLYFIETGVVCVLAHLSERESVTLALTGREGVSGAVPVLGTPVPVTHRLLVVIPGSALSVDAALLRSRPAAFPLILDLTEGYLQVLIAQIAQSAICNRYHLGRERLARWLLLAGDCGATTRLPLTHRVLAEMVGGARSLVTTALAELREAGAIEYRRGLVTLKRRELARQACECHMTLKKTLSRYLPS